MASAAAWRSASAVGILIAGKLGGPVWDEATLLWSFKDDVDSLKESMVEVNALMHDADKRSSQDQGEILEIWMNKFKSVAYDVEDLLDKFQAIELLKRNQSKMKLFFSSCNPLLVPLTMAHKIKKVKKDLDNIKEDGIRLHLVRNYTIESAKGSKNEPTVPWTNEEVDIGMIGRDTEKENIMKLLLKTEAEEHISIIPIIGLGGLGKTTLAQTVFSDKRAQIFDLQVWLFVSKKFDLLRIGEQILSKARSINNGTSERYIPQQIRDLSLIMEQLKTILPTKRYLIILDDIWEESDDNLENLEQMLQYGMKGSKIILTTRTERVVQKLDVCVLARRGIICPLRKSDWINLIPLSADYCWCVMREKALGQDFDSRLEEIGREIAEKCQGLPLIARSFGYLLSLDKSTEAWEKIRDTKIILGITEDHQSREALERLMLSYYYMPFKVKLCFVYCAVFPQSFAVALDHLIQQWRALGYIQSMDDHYCINYLLGMSFLQISKSCQSALEHTEAPIKVVMHDSVHDLARMIAGNELIVPDASEKTTWSTLEKRYGRHMQLTKKQSKALKEFPGKIRSLHVTNGSGMQLQQTSFSKSKYLRVLDLRGCSSEIEGKPASTNISLPSSIHQLMLLRYLDASGLPITALPKYLHNLQNMQTLIMSNCKLESLPYDISCLIELCHLDLSGNGSLNKLPASFGGLTALSLLNLSKCSELKELAESIHKLKNLRHLDLSWCCALEKLPDEFGSLPKLLFLNLSNCCKMVKLPDNLSLKSLEHLNLSSCHELQNLPQDFGNLDKLKFLNLSGCYKIRLLPEFFSQLKQLKDLDLSDCHDLKELPECFGDLSELQSLNLTSCSKLQSLPESFGDLSKLKHLNLSYCVRFEKLPSSFCNLKLQKLYMNVLLSLRGLPDDIGNMTSLTLLEVNTGWFCIDAEIVPSFLRRLQLHHKRVYHTVHDIQEEDYGWCSSVVNLGKLSCHCLEITDLYNVTPEDAKRAKLRDNPDLRDLTLSWYSNRADNMRDAEVLESLIPPRTLERFKLLQYKSRNFPNWMLDISSYLPSLTSVRLDSLICDSLPPFGMLPNLRLLHIEDIPNLRKIGKEFYGEEGTCKRLRVLKLYSLWNFEEWWTTRSGEEEDEFLIPNLHQLELLSCPKLKFLPYAPKCMYWYLFNSDEVLPVHGLGRLLSSTLPFRAEITSLDFSPDKWDRLQQLTTLEELKVVGFGSLSSLPEAIPCFPSLRVVHLCFPNLEILPEWLGQLITLEELHISNCPNPTTLPASIQNLTALKTLNIMLCPRLVERCKGEDAHKISLIPKVELDGRRLVSLPKTDL